MVTGSQQLVDDFEQLKSSLELYPSISIVNTEGQPPDNYEIEYAIRGYCKNSDGNIEITDNHRVRVSLPFGYPHFPPTVKPLTAIFHPDIDPAAIRIADRWQKNPSLPDLVLHIGEMICGNIYTTEEPFNQEAADWYTEHKKDLPLDALSIADIIEADDDFDSLVDDTFASLGLEDDDFLEPEKEYDEADINHIRSLIEQKNIFAANKLLSEIPEEVEIPDREELQQTIGKTLRKADQLHKLAEQLEDMGKLDEAAEVVESLFEIIADSPGAEDLRTRIQQAYTISQPIEDQIPSLDSPTVFEAESEPIEVAADEVPSLKEKRPKERSLRVRPEIPVKLILITVIALGLCIGSISLYFKDQNILSHSQASLLKSQLLIDKKQFDEALEAAEAAQEALNSLTILRFRKPSLEGQIKDLLSSKDLQEGIKGNVLYKGDYIPADTASALRELGVLTEQAASLDGQGKTIESLALYRQALQYANDKHLQAEAEIIDGTIQELELKQALAQAEQAEQGKDWQAAAETYRQALELSGKLSDPETANDITNRLTAATFRHQLDRSKKAFTQSQWQETIESIENAQKLIDENPDVISEQERKDLHRLLVNSKLYQKLSAAREAYEEGNWDRAISTYEDTLRLLDVEAENFEGVLGNSIRKIERTLLMVKIAKIQDQVLLAKGNKDIMGMLKQYAVIEKMIDQSNFADDPSVQIVSKRVAAETAQLQEQLAYDKKVAWLEEHYEEIFRENYPTFKGSQLIKPKVTLLKEVDNKTIFTITCLEKSRGSSSRLELNYMYDGDTDTWSLYDP